MASMALPLTPPGLERPSSWPVRSNRRHAAIAEFNASLMATLDLLMRKVSDLEESVRSSSSHLLLSSISDKLEQLLSTDIESTREDMLEARIASMEALLFRTPPEDFPIFDVGAADGPASPVSKHARVDPLRMHSACEVCMLGNIYTDTDEIDTCGKEPLPIQGLSPQTLVFDISEQYCDNGVQVGSSVLATVNQGTQACGWTAEVASQWHPNDFQNAEPCVVKGVDVHTSGGVSLQNKSAEADDRVGVMMPNSFTSGSESVPITGLVNENGAGKGNVASDASTEASEAVNFEMMELGSTEANLSPVIGSTSTVEPLCKSSIAEPCFARSVPDGSDEPGSGNAGWAPNDNFLKFVEQVHGIMTLSRRLGRDAPSMLMRYRDKIRNAGGDVESFDKAVEGLAGTAQYPELAPLCKSQFLRRKKKTSKARER